MKHLTFPLRLSSRRLDRRRSIGLMDLLRTWESSLRQAPRAQALTPEHSVGGVHCRSTEGSSLARNAGPAEYERSKLLQVESRRLAEAPHHPRERKNNFSPVLTSGEEVPTFDGERTTVPVSAQPKRAMPNWRFALVPIGSQQKQTGGSRAQAAPDTHLHPCWQKRNSTSQVSDTQRREMGDRPYTFAFTLTGNSHEARDAHQRGPAGRMPDCHC